MYLWLCCESEASRNHQKGNRGHDAAGGGAVTVIVGAGEL